MTTAEKQIQLILNEREARALLCTTTIGLAVLGTKEMFELCQLLDPGMMITGAVMQLNTTNKTLSKDAAQEIFTNTIQCTKTVLLALLKGVNPPIMADVEIPPSPYRS